MKTLEEIEQLVLAKARFFQEIKKDKIISLNVLCYILRELPDDYSMTVYNDDDTVYIPSVKHCFILTKYLSCNVKNHRVYY